MKKRLEECETKLYGFDIEKQVKIKSDLNEDKALIELDGQKKKMLKEFEIYVNN